jgi:thiol-disulfide isomerase/thioredoxin
MIAQIGSKAPNLIVSAWFGGKPTNIEHEKGNVILVEVFQVNCPGCFMYGIPDAIRIHQRYRKKGVKVIGLATAFEDYDKNTVDNLKLLIEKQQVIGETYEALRNSGLLINGNKLPYRIPFPVAVDSIKKEDHNASKNKAISFVESSTSSLSSVDDKYKLMLIERMQKYFDSRIYYAETFEQYGLQGTPSSILIDKHGTLRQVRFAQYGSHEEIVKKLLSEAQGQVQESELERPEYAKED